MILQGPADTSGRLVASPVTTLMLVGPADPEARGEMMLMAGYEDGSLSLWLAADGAWSNLTCVSRWQAHLAPVRSVALCNSSGASPYMALSGGDDGLVNLLSLRPPMKIERTFMFAGQAPVAQAHFGSRAPATIVACSKVVPAQICVWALHGYLLATLELPGHLSIVNLRVISEGDAHEGLLCATAPHDNSVSDIAKNKNGDNSNVTKEAVGALELFTLPYLHRVWRRGCHLGLRPTALFACGNGPDEAVGSTAWLGLEDGSFEAVLPVHASETYAESAEKAAGPV